jgi:hypothetical protein
MFTGAPKLPFTITAVAAVLPARFVRRVSEGCIILLLLSSL